MLEKILMFIYTNWFALVIVILSFIFYDSKKWNVRIIFLHPNFFQHFNHLICFGNIYYIEFLIVTSFIFIDLNVVKAFLELIFNDIIHI